MRGPPTTCVWYGALLFGDVTWLLCFMFITRILPDRFAGKVYKFSAFLHVEPKLYSYLWKWFAQDYKDRRNRIKERQSQSEIVTLYWAPSSYIDWIFEVPVRSHLIFYTLSPWNKMLIFLKSLYIYYLGLLLFLVFCANADSNTKRSQLGKRIQDFILLLLFFSFQPRVVLFCSARASYIANWERTSDQMYFQKILYFCFKNYNSVLRTFAFRMKMKSTRLATEIFLPHLLFFSNSFSKHFYFVQVECSSWYYLLKTINLKNSDSRFIHGLA